VSQAAVEPQAAATVVLLRPGRHGLEVLLTRRPASMAFAADMYVFPGGRVDPADAGSDLAARSIRSAEDAAAAMGGDLAPPAALAAHVAAIRELFEEAGVLLADGGADLTVVPAQLASQARSALVGGAATFASVASGLSLRLRTDWLVALSRWVTPPILPRRFDTRFFVAELPEGARISFEGDEVAGHVWLTPAAALTAMARGGIGMWVPTSATLQQLEHVVSIEQIRDRLTPQRLGEIEVETVSAEVTRIVMPAAGGVAGQPVCAYLVGHHRHVLIDPGDPTGPALDKAIALAASRGGSIAAVALTHVDPDHAAGAEAIAEMLQIPVFAGPGGGRPLPYVVHELATDEVVTLGDVALQAVWTPGPRPDHLAFLVGDRGNLVIGGDLRGRRGARAVLAPWDESAASASRERLHRLAPEAAWLSGHPISANVPRVIGR
jgi:endoribonuclease LACTB2